MARCDKRFGLDRAPERMSGKVGVMQVSGTATSGYPAASGALSQPAIQVEKISKRFKDVVAVNGVSLEVPAGQYLALLGPNGAGKTTLVEMLEGIQAPDEGAISILGKNWKNHANWLRQRIGLALQETRFVDKLTTRETLDLFGSFYGQGRSATQNVLERIGLEEKQNSFVVNLSGGQRQRLALGVAIISQPEVLLLDEPTMGLDPNSRQEVWDILRDLKPRGTTLVLTTHYMEEAEALCDRIVIMHQGRFLADGTLSELLTKHGGGEILEFHTPAPPEDGAFRNLPGFLDLSWTQADGLVRLHVQEASRVLARLFAEAKELGMPVDQLQYRRKNLNDIFIALTGRHLHE
jgi:ABC-2 type transport system ATP-binding protein